LRNENKKIKIVVDAMGGDYAPANVVAGTIQALTESKSRFEVILVGRENEIQSELKKFNTKNLDFTVVNASEVIDMHDSPTAALKQKKDSSIIVGLTLHKEGKADAFISAGNTGADKSIGFAFFMKR
jgi:glycerol-3-phosphate acyltransferase PlsX